MKKTHLFCLIVLTLGLADAAAQETSGDPPPVPVPSRLPEPVGGKIPAAEQEELRKPLTVVVRGGNRFTGSLVDFDGNKLSVRAIQSGGEIVLSFPVEDISDLYLPGGSILAATEEVVESGDLPQALPYLEALLISRYPIFPLVSAEDRAFFADVPMGALAIDRPAAAIAYVNALKPFLNDPESREKLKSAELLGRYMLQLNDEAETQALSWIGEQDRLPESALGFFILAAIQFEAGEYDRALRTSLQPLVFSGQIPVPYLPHCYSLAVAATHIMGNDLHRDQLLAEMAERNLDWQPLRALKTAWEELEDLVIEDDEGNPIPLFEATTGDERLLENLDESVGTENFVDPSQLIPL